MSTSDALDGPSRTAFPMDRTATAERPAADRGRLQLLMNQNMATTATPITVVASQPAARNLTERMNG